MAVTDSPSARSPAGREARLGEYRGVAGHWDEAVTADGTIRPYWQALLGDQLTQSPQAAQDRHDLCRRLLKEYGVTYNLPGGREPEQRPWQLDSWPLLISANEWNSLSLGVAQRARLLNQILADIYGSRKLLESGDLPPEIVLANPAFLRAATHVVPPHSSYLTLYAVDVARAPNGRWWVVGDRVDTPAGVGYALENRIVLSRVYPDLIQDLLVTRLAKFFAGLRDRLLALAAARADEPRIVILTPGPFHPTHFEQVYLARYLGFSLVEGEDLTVRDRGVFLKTLSGLLPVDVILRCVRSDFCDPLELRDDSLLGVAGLLQAARAGKVVLANAIGAGAVETPALLPFLPGLCRRLLGEELLLPPVATWWCGQPEALKAVVDGLDRLVIKHAFPSRETDAFLPGKYSPDKLRAMLRTNPHLYVGQEYVSLSTAPTWQNQQLQPRHLMLRLYAAAAGNGEFVVMPGALARAGNSPESI
ncbi:MAG TPA: circularly permuted type 2 ATP-grasp protein, partial [Pirellulaceae bacterium]|nr:circularly permuted type 2 ATP-grasp protein [Pirellulaceae bacterium]